MIFREIVCERLQALKQVTYICEKTFHIMIEKYKSQIIQGIGVMSGVEIISALLMIILGAEFAVSNWWLGISLGIVSIVVFVFISKSIRTSNEGFISFKELFVALLLIAVCSSLITSVFDVLGRTVLATEFYEDVDRLAMEKGLEMAQEFGAPDEQLEKMYTEFEAEQSKSSFSKMIGTFIKGTIFWLILSLIISAIVKKNKPEFE
jgi:hypothetical protein